MPKPNTSLPWFAHDAARYIIAFSLAVAVTLATFLGFIIGDMNGTWEWVSDRAGPILLVSWVPFYALVSLVRARRKRTKS